MAVRLDRYPLLEMDRGGCFFWIALAPHIVNLGAAGTGLTPSVYLMRSSAHQGAVGSYMEVSPEEAGQADFGIPAISIGVQIDLLIVDGPPQTLDQVVVSAKP